MSASYKNIGLYSGTDKIGYTILKEDMCVKVYGTSYLRVCGSRPKWILGLDLY